MREIKNAHKETYCTGKCETRKMTDEERLRYGKPRPNSEELYWILKNKKQAREYQNTYGLSDSDMTALKQCMAQKGYEKALNGLVTARKAQTAEELEITVEVFNHQLTETERLIAIEKAIFGESQIEKDMEEQENFEDSIIPIGLIIQDDDEEIVI